MQHSHLQHDLYPMRADGHDEIQNQPQGVKPGQHRRIVLERMGNSAIAIIQNFWISGNGSDSFRERIGFTGPKGRRQRIH